MKKSELQQIIKEEIRKVLTEAPKSKSKAKIKGGVAKHLKHWNGSDLYTSARELDDILMYYVQDPDPDKTLDLNEIADIILDIIEVAQQEAVEEYKQNRDEI